MAIIIPEVFADAVNAKLESALRIGRVAFDATAVVPRSYAVWRYYSFPPS